MDFLTRTHVLKRMPRKGASVRAIWLLSASAITTALTGCQIGYLVSSGYNEVEILSSRVPLEKALQDSKLTSEQKHKIELAQKAKEFAETALHLKKNNSYNSFVQLSGPYATYAVQAAPKNRLQHYKWWFPIVGHVPYKGYAKKEDALRLAETLQKDGLDTYVRGVSAFSTLGWFDDPILSSMLRYDEIDLVNTIIHETVHATIYISSQADFNERLATFIGDRGAELFYLKLEGPDSLHARQIKAELVTQDIFSEFLGRELKDLESWYEQFAPDQEIPEADRQARLAAIQKRFTETVRPRIGEKYFPDFATAPLNNARLMGYKLYLNNPADFFLLEAKLNHDFAQLIEFCKTLEKKDDPEKFLAEFVRSSASQ